MKKFTIEEKQMLLAGLESYIDHDRINRRVLTGEGKDEWIHIIEKFQEVRIKLVLDIAPIKIKPTDGTGERSCILCGTEANPRVIEWAYVDGKPICQLCFKHYKPEAFEKAMKLDKEYWMKEYPEDFNPDGTFKLGTYENPLPIPDGKNSLSF